MEYKVVYGVSTTVSGAINKLEKEVDKLIKQGYAPQGGVAISDDESTNWLTVCQAMGKE